MPIAQNETAIAIVIEIATMMIVEITILIPFLLVRRFRLKAFSPPANSTTLNGLIQSELEHFSIYLSYGIAYFDHLESKLPSSAKP